MITDNIKKLSLFSNTDIPFKIWKVGDKIDENYIHLKGHYNQIEKICISIDTVEMASGVLWITIIDSINKERKFFSNCTYFAEEYV